MGVGGSVVVELPLGKTAEAATFDLEKNVCSHGLFMMAPNFWDPLSKTLQRPLLLDSHEESGNGSASSSVLVRISQPSDSPHSLRLCVFGVDSLSPRHEQALKDQVRRMLRLSEVEEASVKEFQKMHGEAKERGFGRMFRSPTLFEDMVKCILSAIANPITVSPMDYIFYGIYTPSLWSRTLSMAKALCELQMELQHSSISASVAKVVCGELSCDIRIGNFPSPRELASLGEKFLEKRCNLGYRAIRILKLAQSIVEGKIQLRELEEACSEPSLSNYSNLADQLNEIYGFGPFTCANVLMCMGFYHVIPTDSETVRHLKQVRSVAIL
ncbi:hypothetical protein RHMOL_Rhmol05G0198300 [Rhododendron molle]|uniref:Uncharacterized protein n=1 Tax=Rhododendron molle TaxID=49168 RepID=A0ACC0NS98_RHOML|nr:hypothetical protein RHMOL_Rhmol05G0198300 [Rhododendron molle]